MSNFTRAKIKRLCIDYIGSKELARVSYNELYDYISNKKKISLPILEDQPHNEDLLIIIDNLTDFSLEDYHPRYGMLNPFAIAKDYSIELLDKKNRVLDSVHDEYLSEMRLVKSENDAALSLIISRWSFGIAIAAFVISLAQLTIDAYDIHFGKDFKYENMALANDSLQIEQNKKVTLLLEEQNRRLKAIEEHKPDTIILTLPSQSKK